MNDYKAIAQEYFNTLINEKDISICDKLLSEDYTDNDAPAGTPPGPQETKKFVPVFLNRYPDMKLTVEDIIIEGNKVALRNVWCGTDKITGDKYKKMGNIILLFNEKGQIKQRWSAYIDL
jgi:predicted ester cyclase